MKKFFSIGETARRANVTTETLRHYDRIGLVRPCKVDPWTKYRYYSEAELVRLDAVRALRCMDLSLQEIGELLSCNDFQQIIGQLRRAQENVQAKIVELTRIRESIGRARSFYEEKIQQEEPQGIALRTFPQKALLLSDTLTEPTVENLWSYQRHFYAQVGSRKAEYAFEDVAGVLEEDGTSRMFAVCTRRPEDAAVHILPEGQYLCVRCTQAQHRATVNMLKKYAQETFSVSPDCILSIVVLTGILQWDYEIRIPVPAGRE